MSIKIRFNRPGLLGWVSFLLYMCLVSLVWETGSLFFTMAALGCAMIFQMRTGMHLAKNDSKENSA